VLDPTCGSGTTAYVAEQWDRRWITIDTSRVALTLARSRIMGARYLFYALKDSALGAVADEELRLQRKRRSTKQVRTDKGAIHRGYRERLCLPSCATRDPEVDCEQL
jgi:adenine-specific DNA-methyltransferase